MPNQDQWLSWLRTTMAGLSGWAIGKGYGDANLWAMLTGVVMLVVPYVWGGLNKTDSAKIAAVEAIPTVEAIVVAPHAGNGVQAAAADPNRPKVVTQ